MTVANPPPKDTADKGQLVGSTEVYRIAEILRVGGERQVGGEQSWLVDAAYIASEMTIAELEAITGADVTRIDAKAMIRECIDQLDRSILVYADERRRFKQDIGFWESPLLDSVMRGLQDTQSACEQGRASMAALYARHPDGYRKILEAVAEPGDNSPADRAKCLPTDFRLILLSEMRSWEYPHAVWECKRARNEPIADPQRERDVIRQRVELARKIGIAMSPASIEKLFTEYMEQSKACQQAYRMADLQGHGVRYCPRCGEVF